MSIIFSAGKYGGFYISLGYTKRICQGWIALTFIPLDHDVMMRNLFLAKFVTLSKSFLTDN